MKLQMPLFYQLMEKEFEYAAVQSDKYKIVGVIQRIVCVTCIVSGSVMYFSDMKSYLSIFLLGLVCFLGWLLSRAGYQTGSSLLLIASLLIAVQYNIFQGYGMHDVAIIAWPALIFFVGLLFGSRVIPYFTTFIMILAVVTKILPNAMNFTGYTDTGDLIVMLLILVAFNFVGMSILHSNEISIQHMRRSDERFQAIYHSINDAIFIHDHQTGAILDVNKKMLEMYGYTLQEALLLNIQDISSGIPPYTRENAIDRVRKAALQGAQYFEWQAKDKNGHLFWVDVNMKFTTIADKHLVLATVRDITERKEAEKARRESETRFQEMADLLPQVFFECDLQGQIIYANQYALDLFGYDQIEPGLNVLDYVDETQHIRAIKTIQMLIDGQDDNDHKYNIKKKDGSQFPALIYPSLIRKESHPFGFRCVVIDISEIKRSELALRDSEERYRQLYENSTVGLYRTTPDGRILLANPALVEMMGFSSLEDFLSRNLEKEGYAPGNVRSHFIEMIEQNGEVKGLESAWTRKDGSVIIVSESAGVTRDEDGKSLYYDGTVEDITKRKKAEYVLRESESRFRAFVEQAPVAIGVFNLNGNGMYANQKFIETLELPSIEDMVGRPAFEYFAPQFREESKERTRRRLQGLPVPDEYESIALHADGSEFPVQLAVAPIQLLDETASIAFLKDITEQKRLEEAYKQSEAKYRRMVETANEGVIVLDRDQRMTLINQQAASMLGYTIEELLGQKLESLLFEDDLKDHQEQMQLRAQGQSTVYERCFRQKNGNRLWAIVSATAITDAEGHFDGAFGMITDITDRKLAEEKLLKSETLFRAVVEHNHDGIILMDAERIPFYVSPSYTKINGYLPEEWIGVYGPDYIHPDDRAITACGIRDVLQKPGKVVTSMYRIRHKKGHWFWVETTVTNMLHDPDIHALVLNSRDITERKLAEEALRDGEERYHSLFDQSIVVVSDEDGMWIQISPLFCDMLGYSMEELMGMSFTKITHPDDLAANLEQIKRMVKGEIDNFILEKRYLHKNGEVLWVNISVTSIRDTSGTLVQTIAVIQDITERKRSEKTLIESEARFREVLENSLDASYKRNLQTNAYDYLSPVFTSIFSYSPYEFMNLSIETILDLIHPDDRPKGDRVIAESLSGAHGSSYQWEYRFKRKDGQYHWLHDQFTMFRDAQGQPAAWIGCVSDITERKRAEEALRVSEENYRGAIAAAGLVPYVIDYDAKRYTFIGENILELTGYPAEEITPTILKESIQDSKVWLFDNPDLTLDEAQRKFLSGEIGHWSNDMRILTRTGEERWLNDASVPLRNEYGRVTHAIGVIQDLTERKHAEENRIAREIAERANRAKSEFISRMSHELRTPLNAILGFAQLLKMDELKPNQERGVDQINKSGRHLLNLVNEVLDIARIEAGKMHISPEPVRLEDAVKEALELIRPLAEDRHLSLSLEYPSSSDVFVKADHQSFRQVLLNLLSNAVKYNREGGKIAVTSSLTIDGCLRLQVRDTGKGIPPDKMEHLFVPFERLGMEYVEQEGTGLGLALSKGLVEAMGGRIGAESKLGEGSIFWLELKLVTERLKESIMAEVDENLSDRMRSGRGLVLYVEDSLANLKLVEAIMERMPQIKLITAMQGRLAMDLAKEHKPDLILLDLHLPDIHGSEVLHWLKTEPATQKTPVIILSANALPESIADLLAQGAHAYLTKPIDIKEFLKVVDESMRETGGTRQEIEKQN